MKICPKILYKEFQLPYGGPVNKKAWDVPGPTINKPPTLIDPQSHCNFNFLLENHDFRPTQKVKQNAVRLLLLNKS